MADKFWNLEYSWSECLFMDIVALYGAHDGPVCDIDRHFFCVLTDYLHREHDFSHYDGGNTYFHFDMEDRFFSLKIRNLSELLEKAVDKYLETTEVTEIDMKSIVKFCFALGNMPSVKTYNIMNLD